MEFYDIVSEACDFDEAFVKRIGLSKVFRAGKDFPVVKDDGRKGQGNAVMAMGPAGDALLHRIKEGAPMIVITDLKAERKVLAFMKDHGSALCIPLSYLTIPYGIERSRSILKASRLYVAARKAGLEVFFASLAQDRAGMLSSMQMVELAKLIGADETYARFSMGNTGKAVSR